MYELDPFSQKRSQIMYGTTVGTYMWGRSSFGGVGGGGEERGWLKHSLPPSFSEQSMTL